ncbi:COP9 signalosome complex subunit 1 [Plectosphaerella cucumerina]|uniref:COP9 signalosome complex subunit 1 n=1 Tax=Plectosphaerella cucumerina TaxID=40658 RepID=A0A8K0TD47_9PEZI|nr:COP9 signalosome complex subunit 1 [Plectosphaerella cucumerina]
MAEEGPILLDYFANLSQQGQIVVYDTPKLDLDLYIQNYTGRTRFDRLSLIARTCVPLAVEALKAAVAEAKSGLDVQRYRETWEMISIVAPKEPEAIFDQAWADRVTKEAQEETHRLEQQLKGYKNNLIKESIRMGNEDLGRHYERIGNLTGAAEAYNRMRADVSTTKQIVDVGRHLSNIAVQRQDWALLQGSLTKMTGAQQDEDKSAQTYGKVLQGIAQMGLEKYDDAAYTFLHIEALKDVKDGGDYNNIATPNDVAVYGGLLALATLDRRQLQTRVLDNAQFRTFLELEPHIRKAISLFVNGRYSACLAILESYRADYLLDIYLQRHVPTIYSRIRSKCIVQYFEPFSCVTLANLEAAFGIPGQSLQSELVSMIKSGALQARVNTMDQLLVAVNPNQRAALQAAALASTKAYEREALERIRQISLTSADLEVKGAKKIVAATQANVGPGGGGEGVGDVLFDDSGVPMGMAPLQGQT